MKTTLDLPDELMRAAKIRAATEGRKLKDVVAELIRRGLTAETAAGAEVTRTVRLPLIDRVHDAADDEEMTPERAAETLTREDIDLVARQHARVTITRNGHPAAVLISPDDLEGLEETLAILGDRSELTALHDGIDDLNAGRTVTLEELRADADRA